ncbi:MAG: PAS domain S-box protein [Rhodocyclaceae bacterium]|nr:PAS domain S-box protein [Rhodocyclaceae bacterium]
MNLNTVFRWQSLKTRVTLFTLVIFLVGIWSLAFYGSRMLREDMQGLLGDQQLSTVSILAAGINHELDERLRALEMVAGTVSPAMLGNTATLQALLEQRPILRDLFNGGVIVHRLDGTAIADVPRSTGRIGANYMNIDTVAAALKEGKTTIGRPVMGTKLKAPVFGMTAPIRDTQGKVIGALGGATNLGKPNFLDRFTERHYGQAGGYLLVARQHRLIVTATDKRLIMTTLPAPGARPLIDRFIQGYEGSGVVVNPLGVEVLCSAKGIPVADWFVAATLPTAEAFAPIRNLQQRLLLAALVLTLLTGGLTWWMLKRQLSPLFAAAKTLAATDQQPRALPVARQDEIGELIGGFNRLLERLVQREAILRESEARYRCFFEFSPDAIFVHWNNRIIFANEVTARMFHADSAATLIGRDWHELVAPEDWPAADRRVAALTSGEASHMPPLERRHVTLDGQPLAMEATATRIVFDGKPAVLTVIRDITERKRAEAQRLTEARQQRDTLVREVHHRIKNNLQSVAGLLQRELGKFVELDPRLAAAISQVHAIAVVHGLQSAGADEAIRLCDSVRNICKMVSDLSQRPVLFHIEGEQTSFVPIRIESSEAVPVALVLNELILNAVKHSPDDSCAPTVSLSADGASAQIVIRNALTGAPGFNIDTGEGLGTGLRLVSSLLPRQGAQLSYEPDTEGFMLTRLKLTAPVVETADRKAPD